MAENELSEQESLLLIQQMINKAKNSYHDTGIGPILWGAVITVCSLVTYAEIKLKFDLPFDIWLLTIVAIVPQILIISREKKRKNVKAYDDTVMNYVWTCFGVSVFILSFINSNIQSHFKEIADSSSHFEFSTYSSSFFLLLYGFPTIITGGIKNFKPMLYGGILCWVCCIAAVYTNIETDMLLIALSAIGAWLVPGIILYRKHQSKLKVANV